MLNLEWLCGKSSDLTQLMSATHSSELKSGPLEHVNSYLEYQNAPQAMSQEYDGSVLIEKASQALVYKVGRHRDICIPRPSF